MHEMLEKLSDPELCQPLLKKVIDLAEKFKEIHGRKPAFMEVCGSHTMAFARSGIRKVIQPHIHLVAGPGCPVCVTDQQQIDAMIELAQDEERILCTFGDMIRVPGTNGTLQMAKSNGKDIRIIYSPLDAVKIAKENPSREVIFLGIGFETTIPILAATIQLAEREDVTNFSIWMTTKLVEPIVRHLLEAGEVKIDGFVLPGHVSIVLGRDGYLYLAEEYHISGVITGFEPVQLLSGLYYLLSNILDGKAEIINDYPSVVSENGNKHAQDIMEKYLTKCDEAWRGIGMIEGSGYDVKHEYSHYNAKKRFVVKVGEVKQTKCRCGEIIRGLIDPEQCPLFGKACTPLNPIGPCMVSSEGSCAAHYQYMIED